MKNRVFVIGVGMTKFEKPGKRDWDYPDMAVQAGTRALEDAGIKYDEVQCAAVGYVYGDSTCGQRAVYGLGLTGIPVYNVNNNCSTGSTALFMAKQFVEGGVVDCALALGFEKMERGSLSAKYTDRTNPLDQHVNTMSKLREITSAPFAPQMFGNAGREHMEKYSTSREHFARVAEKNHRHSANNPYSQFRDVYTLDQIMKSPKVYDPLTKLQCCPTSDGAAAAIIASERFVRKHGLEHQAVEIIGMSMATDMTSTFKDSCIKMVGADMSRKAATEAYQQAGVSANDVQVVELHDCFSCNELLTYEALGLCPEGQGGKLVEQGNVTYGGKWVVNPSGGLISKGHPLGATGLAQCSELCWQLRGMCGKRQVPNCKVGLQHNIGLGGAAVVGIYKLGFPNQFKPYPSNKKNMAIEEQTVAPAAASGSSGFQSDAVFQQMAGAIKAHPEVIKRVNGVYRFNITSGGNTKTWTVDLKGSSGVSEGENGKADCTITITDADYVALIKGEANGQQLFMGGKLKISGNMGLAMKLSELQKISESAGAAPAKSDFASDAVFAGLGEAIKQNPAVVKRVNGIYCFNITANGKTKSWTVDLKNGAGSVKEGAVGKADCTITITDADYVALISGKANGQQLFMSGKLKISGNMGLAMKLQELSKLNPSGAAATAGAAFASDAIFPILGSTIQESPDILKKVNGIYCFVVKSGSEQKTWTVDLKNAPGSVKEGKVGKVDCTVTLADSDFVSLITGKANGQQLFMSGKLKLQGNMALALKLEQLKQLSPSTDGFQSDVIFGGLNTAIKANPATAKKVNAVYLFNVKSDDGSKTKEWTVDLKTATGAKQGKHEKPDCTITIADSDFVGMLTGSKNGQQLFMSGKMKISGNMALAMKLEQLKSMAPGMAAGASGSDDDFKCDAIFPVLAQKIKQDPTLIKKINGIYCFNITDGPNGGTKSYTVDLKNAPGAVREGAPAKADCTIGIPDEEFVDLLTGKQNGQQLFMAGKLQISGNMALAMKLGQLSSPKASL